MAGKGKNLKLQPSRDISPLDQDSGRVPLDKMRLPLTSLETSVSRTGGPAMISKPWEWFTNNTHIPKKPVISSWMLASPRTRNDHPWQVWQDLLYKIVQNS